MPISWSLSGNTFVPLEPLSIKLLETVGTGFAHREEAMLIPLTAIFGYCTGVFLLINWLFDFFAQICCALLTLFCGFLYLNWKPKLKIIQKRLVSVGF